MINLSPTHLLVKRQMFERVFEEAQHSLVQAITLRLNQQLAAAVDILLGRAPYVRRERVPRHMIRAGHCQRCRTRHSYRFTRNGYRLRTLLTLCGVIGLDLPRVRCQCGGSVELDFDGWLRPYQRLAHDVEQRIQRWAALCLSLRQMQGECQQLFGHPLGLQTFYTRLHQLAHLSPQQLLACDSIPPVVEVDAIWFTQLRPNGTYRRDRTGRRRAVKGRFKRPLLIALGIWPDSDHQEILAWHLANSESEADWLFFLSALEGQGLRGDNGLQVIIHDGGSGLCAALDTIYFGVPYQRCLFHKLRNIFQTIHVPEQLSIKQKARHRKAVFRHFKQIWQPQRLPTVLNRYLAVCRRFRYSQPQAVATLRRHFRQTLTYFQLLAEHPTRSRQYLRTTSHLERFNRTLRRHSQVAGAYHSDAGLLVPIAQEVDRFNCA